MLIKLRQFDGNEKQVYAVRNESSAFLEEAIPGIGQGSENPFFKPERAHCLRYDHVGRFRQLHVEGGGIVKRDPILKSVLRRHKFGNVDDGFALNGMHAAGAGAARKKRENTRSAAHVHHHVARFDDPRNRLTVGARPRLINQHRQVIINEVGVFRHRLAPPYSGKDGSY